MSGAQYNRTARGTEVSGGVEWDHELGIVQVTESLVKHFERKVKYEPTWRRVLLTHLIGGKNIRRDV